MHLIRLERLKLSPFPCFLVELLPKENHCLILTPPVPGQVSPVSRIMCCQCATKNWEFQHVVFMILNCQLVGTKTSQMSHLKTVIPDSLLRKSMFHILSRKRITTMEFLIFSTHMSRTVYKLKCLGTESQNNKQNFNHERKQFLSSWLTSNVSKSKKKGSHLHMQKVLKKKNQEPTS